MSYLVTGEFVLTMRDGAGPNGVIRDGAVYVSESAIVDVGEFKHLRARYPGATVIGSSCFWVMPGFVNAHQHGKGVTNFQLGGFDESFELSRVRGAPQAKVPPYLDTLYAGLRMIESGITTTFHYNASRNPDVYESDVRERLRAYSDTGLRVSFGLDIRNRNHLVYGDDQFVAALPNELKAMAQERARSRTADPKTYFRIAEQLDRELNGTSKGRMKLCLAPAGPQWCTEDLLQSIREFADARGLGIQIHALETKYQRAYFLRNYGKSAIQWLDELGFLTPRVSLAHGVWLAERDIALVAERGCAVVHNPSSNLRLKSGIAPIAAFHAAGIPLALGLDSSALNDDMDMLQEMRLSANLQRVPGVTSEVLSLEDIFAAGTRSGSQILGWGNTCGTLEPGKEADLILVDTERLKGAFLSAAQNPIDALIYRGRSNDVDTVMIAGEIVYHGKKHRRLDSQSLAKQLRACVEPSQRDPFDEQLLPHMIHYYASWDQEPVEPRHIVNSR